MRISIGSDHGGYELKEILTAHLKESGHQIIDKGCFSKDSVDYPDFAEAVATSVSQNETDIGIMIDGAGIGSCMVANKIAGVRAALCNDLYTARNAREHNDANMLTLGSMVVGSGKAKQIVDIFISSTFQGGRHQRRVDKINRLDRKDIKNYSQLSPTGLEESIRNIVETLLNSQTTQSSSIAKVDETQEIDSISESSFLVTEEYLRSLWKKGMKDIKLPRKSIITPLARDFARDHHLNFV